MNRTYRESGATDNRPCRVGGPEGAWNPRGIHALPAFFIILSAVILSASLCRAADAPVQQSATTADLGGAAASSTIVSTPPTAFSQQATATRKASKEADLAYSTAEKAHQEGYYNAAIEAYRKFARTYPNDDRVSWALLQAGDLLVEQGQDREAIASYGEVIKVRGDSMDARLARTRLANISEGVLSGVREKAKNATAEDERMKALWEIAGICEMMQDFQLAAVAYQDVKRATTMESWRKRANEKLAEIVEARIKRNASGPPVPDEEEWKAIAQLAEVAEAWPRAAEFYQKLSEATSDPVKKVEYRLANARAQQHWGKGGKSLEICSEVIKSDVRGALREEAYQCAGTALESSKEFTKALKLYETFLTEAENERAAAWAMLRKAYCLERTGATEKALNTYRDIIDRYPKEYTSPEALIGTGRIYETRREFPAARTAYNRVVADYPDSHKVVEAKGLIQALTAKEQEWERIKGELGRLSERYPRRERKDGEGM